MAFVAALDVVLPADDLGSNFRAEEDLQSA